MKVGIMFASAGPFARPEVAVPFAELAEELGFESLWTVEHVVVPAGYQSQYPYSRDGRMPGGEDAEIPDPLIWMSYVAGATSTIKLATGILILPQRNPVVLAKETATLDMMSGGRLLLGVGVGWLREEFEAIGVPFEERGARTDEYVEALRVLWRDAEPTFSGRFVSFTGAKSYPKPAQSGGIPVIVGGNSLPAARRAGRLGDGFFPALTNAEKLTPLLEEMRNAAHQAGRDPDAIEVTAGGALDVDGILRLAHLGVSRLIIPPLAFDVEGLRRSLTDFAEQVMAKLP